MDTRGMEGQLRGQWMKPLELPPSWHLGTREGQALRGLSQATGWAEVLQWYLKPPQMGPGESEPRQGGPPDSPLVVRLPKGKTGEGLVLPGGPAE